MLASLVPSQADLTKFVGGAVQWDFFARFDALTSDTYQVGTTAHYPGGAVTPGAEAAWDGQTMPDGAFRMDPVLLLRAEVLAGR